MHDTKMFVFTHRCGSEVSSRFSVFLSETRLTGTRGRGGQEVSADESTPFPATGGGVAEGPHIHPVQPPCVCCPKVGRGRGGFITGKHHLTPQFHSVDGTRLD